MGFFIFHTSLRVCKFSELLPAFYSSFSVLVFPAAFTVRRRLSPGPAEVRGNQQRSAALETFRNSHRRSAAFAVPHACLLHSVLLLRASSTSNCSGLFTPVLISRRRFQMSQRFQVTRLPLSPSGLFAAPIVATARRPALPVALPQSPALATSPGALNPDRLRVSPLPPPSS